MERDGEMRFFTTCSQPEQRLRRLISNTNAYPMAALRRRGLERMSFLVRPALSQSSLTLRPCEAQPHTHTRGLPGPAWSAAGSRSPRSESCSSIRIATGISVPIMTRRGKSEIACVSDEPLSNEPVTWSFVRVPQTKSTETAVDCIYLLPDTPLMHAP